MEGPVTNRLTLFILATPQTKSSWSGLYCRRKREESQILPPSFLEGTTTGFILKVSERAHSCTDTVVMVGTDTQGTELHKPTSCATLSDPSLTVLIPHLTPWPTLRL